jgi:hypothetical protein
VPEKEQRLRGNSSKSKNLQRQPVRCMLFACKLSPLPKVSAFVKTCGSATHQWEPSSRLFNQRWRNMLLIKQDIVILSICDCKPVVLSCMLLFMTGLCYARKG